jgi:hypothetical protein
MDYGGGRMKKVRKIKLTYNERIEMLVKNLYSLLYINHIISKESWESTMDYMNKELRK